MYVNKQYRISSLLTKYYLGVVGSNLIYSLKYAYKLYYIIIGMYEEYMLISMGKRVKIKIRVYVIIEQLDIRLSSHLLKAHETYLSMNSVLNFKIVNRSKWTVSYDISQVTTEGDNADTSKHKNSEVGVFKFDPTKGNVLQETSKEILI